MTQPTNTPKRRGCLFYGCLTCLILFVIVCAVAFFTARYFVHRINSVLAEYTDTSPMPLPKVEMPSAELDQLQKRWKIFNNSAEADTNAPSFVLTAGELNALLYNSPEMRQFKNKFYISIETNKIRGQVSLPLDKYFRIPFIDFKGRYLNGAGLFKVAITNGALIVAIDELEVKGKPVPAEYMSAIRGVNLAEDAQTNPTNAAAIGKYESLEVNEGKIVIKAKGH